MGASRSTRGGAVVVGAAFALAAIGALSAPRAAVAAEKTYKPDLARCAGFTAKDAAPFLGVPPERVTAKIEKVHDTLVTCAFSAGSAGATVAFSIEVARDARAAAEQMESYRGNLEVAAETAPFKDRLPRGAWSEIGGGDLGDENVWTDVNGSFTARKGNVTVQVTMPEDKLKKIDVGQAVLAKL